MKLLITSFEPFGGRSTNTSLEVWNLLKIHNLKWNIVKHTLPVSYDFTPLKNLLEREKPDFVLMMGEAGNRTKVCLEKVAINFADATISDNQGVVLKNAPVLKNGPDAFFTRLDVSQIVREISHPSLMISLSAGSYVCNYQYYHALHALSLLETPTPCLFIHVPYSHEEENSSPLSLREMTDLIESVIEVCLKTMF